MELAERMKIISHEIPKDVTAIHGNCYVLLREMSDFIKSAPKRGARKKVTVKSGKKGTTVFKLLDSTAVLNRHLNRVAENLNQIHHIAAKMREIRDKVTRRISKDKTRSLLDEVQDLKARFKDKPARFQEEHALLMQRAFTERPEAAAKARAEIEGMASASNNGERTPEFVEPILSEDEIQRTLQQLHAYSERLHRHAAAVRQEMEQPPATMEPHYGNLIPLLENVDIGIRNLYNHILASMPGGMQTFDLRDILKDLNTEHPLLKSKEVARVQLHLPANPLMVLAEKNLLRLVVHNFVSNAVKHRDPDRDLEIHVHAFKQPGGRIHVRVTDTGKGIPEHLLPHIFEPWYSGRAKEDREHDAHGLGLPIAKHAIEVVHRGKISVESEVGKGSFFDFELPKMTGRKTE